MNKNCLCSWSGGKDSCFALMQAILQGYAPKVLLNILNEQGKISRSHGIPSAVLQRQAEAVGIPIQLVSSSWQEYEIHFTEALNSLKEEWTLTHVVFGDIDLQPHRDWEEKVCANAGLTALLPLWQQNRKELVMQMLEVGIEAIIVSCNDTMGKNFIGRKITPELVDELESMGIDACGENGEFHTLVLDCPLFTMPVNVEVSGAFRHEAYWFAEIV